VGDALPVTKVCPDCRKNLVGEIFKGVAGLLGTLLRAENQASGGFSPDFVQW